MNILLIVIWIISLAALFLIPYSIAVFYQRRFKRKTYPYLFIFSLLLFAASSFGNVDQSSSYKMLFFAIGGILLGGTSMRLYLVMTWRGK